MWVYLSHWFGFGGIWGMFDLEQLSHSDDSVIVVSEPQYSDFWDLLLCERMKRESVALTYLCKDEGKINK
jgi:hypothetical protein